MKEESTMITIRIPKETKNFFETIAEKEDRTLSNLMIYATKSYIKEKENGKNKIPERNN